jgi:hypothetical protein
VRVIAALLALIVSALVDAADEKPKDGFVPDADTAITLPRDAVRGVAHAEIVKADGRIIRVFHSE